MAHSAPKPLWESTGDERASGVRAMFASIAPSYDRLNGLMSLGRHQSWRVSAIRAARFQAGESLLDICCGTGDFLIAADSAVSDHGSLTGIDFCQPMIEIASGKTPARLNIADACNLPFQDCSFDVVTVGWGLRNVPDLKLALREALRVLKPGGRLVSLDCFTPDSGIARLLSAPASRLLPVLGKMTKDAGAYQYLPKSTEGFVRRRELEQALADAGFTQTSSKAYLLGNVCMHLGVKPSL